MPASSPRPASRTITPATASRHARSHLASAMLALLVAGLAGCEGNDATGPEVPLAEAPSLATTSETTTMEPTAGTLTAGTTWFVSPTGSNTDPGTQAKPFKTLSKALEVAKTGDIIRLAAGTYSKATNGEQFSLGAQQVLVPGGVTIVGAVNGTTRLSILQGAGSFAGEIGLNLRGAAVVKNLELRAFNTAVRAAKGTQSLGNLLLAQNFVGLVLGDSARATLTGSTVLLQSNSTGASVVRRASFVMSGGSMSGDATSCELNRNGVLLEEHAQATLKNGATLQHVNGPALQLLDTTKATVTGATVTRTYPSGCQPLALISVAESGSLIMTNAHVTGQGGSHTTGLETKGTGQVTLDGTEVSGFTETGIAVRAANSKLTVRNQSVLARNHIAIDARFASSASLLVTNSLMDDNDVGIIAAKLRLRLSALSGNHEADVLANGAGVDLGTALSPGGNALKRTTLGGTSVSFLGAAFPGAVNAGTIKAVGNTWEALTQGTDGQGHYTSALVDGTHPNAHGVNFDMPNASTKLQL